MDADAAPAALAGYHHLFLPGSDGAAPPLLLLHRTGRDEHDLVPLARRVSPGSPLLAVRGDVLEEGKPRFFRRVGRGDFDRDDLRVRTEKMAGFVRAATRHYGIARPVALGHSNGANIVWSVLFAGGADALAGAILLRPFLPFVPDEAATLPGFPVLVASGRADDLVTPDKVGRLPDQLRRAGADLTLTMLDAGHDLVEADETAVASWLEDRARR